MKDLSGERLALAVRDARAGNATIPASIAARLIARIPESARKGSLADYGLTAREREITELIAQGYGNEKLSRALGISMGTVKNYVSSVYSKLAVENRQQAALLISAFKSGDR